MQQLKGIGASSGIAIGQALVLKKMDLSNAEQRIENTTDELTRLQRALDISRQELKELYNKTASSIGPDEAQIFQAHIAMLEDDEFWSRVRNKIESESKSAVLAIRETAEFFIEMFSQMDNEYIRERIEDIKEIKYTVSMALVNRKVTQIEFQGKRIIAAHDLTAADTVKMDKSKVLGFVVEHGGRTSHSAIIARSIGIPCVVGAVGVMDFISDDGMLIVDGGSGEIIIDPDEKATQEFTTKLSGLLSFQSQLNIFKNAKSVSKDGVRYKIFGNIGDIDECDSVIQHGGEGIGLFRTEFLFMGCDAMPTEDVQFKAYKKAAEKMQGKPVIIRTLDIGGDKELPYLKMEPEENPFLGVRAIRLCLSHPELWRVQLSALLRASAYGHIKIMLPMVSAMDELIQAKDIIEEVKNELKLRNLPYDEQISVGMMIETPSAAILSDVFAKEVDFFSIGTNDLVQYTLAADRGNPNVTDLYSYFNPAVLRLIQTVIHNAHQCGIEVGMCGEAAADIKLLPILMGMGLDEFSVSPGLILELRYAMKQIGCDIDDLVKCTLALPTSDQVENYLS